MKARPVEVRSLDELPAAFKVARAEADAVVVTDEAVFAGSGGAKRIADAAMASRLPAIGFTDFAKAGGVIGYGVDFPDIWRQSMTFVDKILKGAKPADQPIQQPTRFELVINLKSAKALGLAIPQSLLARADHRVDCSTACRSSTEENCSWLQSGQSRKPASFGSQSTMLGK